MANDIANVIVAPTHVINALIDHDGLISFSKIKPWDGDEDVPCISATMDMVDKDQRHIKFPTRVLKNDVEGLLWVSRAIRNIALTGYGTWYDHHVDQWGTKWDAYRQEIEIGTAYSQAKFFTAWVTPTPIFEALSSMFPDEQIEVYYADEAHEHHNCGMVIYQNGKATTDNKPVLHELKEYTDAMQNIAVADGLVSTLRHFQQITISLN